MSKSEGRRAGSRAPSAGAQATSTGARGWSQSDHSSLPQIELPPELSDRLLAWYRENGRDLPWRHTRDPYAIIVSEIMLQQTRVETVLDRYGRFLERFPDISALADADVEEVLAEWSGLGYYRRARSLHALAQTVVETHGGRVPDDLDSLLELPGIGPYTAAAVASICFGLPALAIDGNIGRALCRLAAIEDDPKKSSVQRQLRELVSAQFAAHPPGELNQAVMELGARVCLPRSPRCEECPVADMCAARWLGIESRIPSSRRQEVLEVREEALLVESDGSYFLVRGQRPGVLRDMWELPTLDSRLELGSLSAYIRKQGWPFEHGEVLGEIRHGITNRRITCSIFRGRTVAVEPKLAIREAPEDGESPDTRGADPHDCHSGTTEPARGMETGWFTLDEIAALPLAASARKAFAKVLGVDLTRR